MKQAVLTTSSARKSVISCEPWQKSAQGMIGGPKASRLESSPGLKRVPSQVEALSGAAPILKLEVILSGFRPK